MKTDDIIANCQATKSLSSKQLTPLNIIFRPNRQLSHFSGRPGGLPPARLVELAPTLLTRITFGEWQVTPVNLDFHNDFAIITCYFNPNHYQTRRRNFETFASSINVRGTVLVIECAFDDSDYELPSGLVYKRVRAKDLMWQKERLLNILIAELPQVISKVAWLDCDLVFENDGWLADADKALDTYRVVQLFERVVRLPQGSTQNAGGGETRESFGSVYARSTMPRRDPAAQHHGHTGYAWAACRDVLRHGLYDGCISGLGDHLMAHAFAGDWGSPCLKSHFEENLVYRKHFEAWYQAVHPLVYHKIGYVPGKIFHLWHGNYDDRRYVAQTRELNALNFSPGEDLQVGACGCFEWNSLNPDLRTWAKHYFSARHEDR